MLTIFCQRRAKESGAYCGVERLRKQGNDLKKQNKTKQPVHYMKEDQVQKPNKCWRM